MQRSRLTTQNKQELRKFCKEKRLEIFKDGDTSKISNRIVEAILSSDFFRNAENILLFYPKKYEINLCPLLNENKNFFLPKCKDDNLLVCPHKKGFELELSAFKVQEPKTNPIENLEILDLIFTPALCADKNLNRLGYGKGYYDRFFQNKNLRAQKIIVMANNLLFEKIPNEKTDIKCDKIITEKTIISL